jgi:hypothetical protein
MRNPLPRPFFESNPIHRDHRRPKSVVMDLKNFAESGVSLYLSALEPTTRNDFSDLKKRLMG